MVLDILYRWYLTFSHAHPNHDRRTWFPALQQGGLPRFLTLEREERNQGLEFKAFNVAKSTQLMMTSRYFRLKVRNAGAVVPMQVDGDDGTAAMPQCLSLFLRNGFIEALTLDCSETVRYVTC